MYQRLLHLPHFYQRQRSLGSGLMIRSKEAAVLQSEHWMSYALHSLNCVLKNDTALLFDDLDPIFNRIVIT